MAMNNYFDFAEDDYKYFVDSYNSGLVARLFISNNGVCEETISSHSKLISSCNTYACFKHTKGTIHELIEVDDDC